MVTLLTDTAKSSLGNQSAPPYNGAIQETLTRIGGLVPSIGGEYAGKPVYRLAWGQAEKHFEQGKMRIRFVDRTREPLITQERFFVAPEVFNRCANWINERQKTLRQKFLEFDFNVFAHNTPLSDYLKQHESSLNYIQLAIEKDTREKLEMDYLSIASVSAPKDWIYLSDVLEVEEIGKPFWYVMRWISAQQHGGRASWEQTRYAHNAYIPELNDRLPIVDQKGAFPEHGFWVPRLEIADYVQPDGSVSYELARTAEPTGANCIEPILEMEFQMRNKNMSKLGIEQFHKERQEQEFNEQVKKEDAFEDMLYEKFEVKRPNTNLLS